MSQEQIEVVRRCWAELEHDPPKVSHGHHGVQVWVHEIWDVFSDIHHEIEEILEGPDGETVVTVQRTQTHMRHTGIAGDVPWATVWQFKESRVWRAQGYMRREDALEAAGLSD